MNQPSPNLTDPVTISALTTHIVTLFESDPVLRDVWVTGEVSTWKQAASGHVYFSLKDSGATINAVMWRKSAYSHSWLPQAGDQIVAHGYVGVYPERGAYQLYVNRIQPAGRGQLYAQFEALKQRLMEEGLFDEERKRPIPPLPRRIGVVTSADAAALRDILRVLSMRWPLIDVVVFSTLVQGAEAPHQIANALATANQYHEENEPLETLILARGGGSIEDLWAFNDERVAYAIVGSRLPVVAGIGHETDVTIADFVADLRAATPTAAAAAVVPDRMEVIEQFTDIAEHLSQRALDRIALEQNRQEQLQMRLFRLHPQRQIDQQRQRIDDRERRLQTIMRGVLTQQRTFQKGAQLRLAALNPLGVLSRGYSIVQRLDGQVVTDPKNVEPNEELDVRAAKGTYRVQKILPID
ncbi:exodeoxyribonuclease VII large subunit [Chloroflexi bacterium TSY]|nr:exodeoxyribonuclease VII large subunit [Chloroflexi bacterium TSY]